MSIVELTCIKCPKGCQLTVELEENSVEDGLKTGIEAGIEIGIETEIETGIENGIETGIETGIKAGIKSIEGNACPRGAEYAEKETTNPTRMVTSIVRISGSQFPVLPVRLNEEIPKDAIFTVMEAIRGCSVSAPIEIGDVLIENACGLGVNVVAAASASVKSEG